MKGPTCCQVHLVFNISRLMYWGFASMEGINRNVAAMMRAPTPVKSHIVIPYAALLHTQLFHLSDRIYPSIIYYSIYIRVLRLS